MKINLLLILSIAYSSTVYANIDSTSDKKITAEKPALTGTQETIFLNLVGRWYDSQPTKEGGMMERSANGTYKIIFKITSKDGKVEQSAEVGLWGACGNVYFSIFKGYLVGEKFEQVDPTNPYSYDAYNIIKLSEERFEYKHVTSGNKYIVKRVSSEFKFIE